MHNRLQDAEGGRGGGGVCGYVSVGVWARERECVGVGVRECGGTWEAGEGV